MVSLSNHDDESMAYDTLRQAQGDTSGLFAISSIDGYVKNNQPSLRGAERRSNLGFSKE
jgi:hypothetical protein